MFSIFRFSLLVVTVLLMAACRGVETETPVEVPTLSSTSTPDPCMSENLPAEVEKVNAHMREFDDYAALASNTPQSQLIVIIPEMQRVLRAAEDEQVPACLTDLKELQVRHMKVVVQTLLAFMGGADANAVSVGITEARNLHAQYDVEMARLLGVTLSFFTPIPPTQPVVSTSTPVPTVINPGPNQLNLRTLPDFNAPATNVLEAGASAVALGRTDNNQWILVEVPDKPGSKAWVYATVVQLSVPIEALPVSNP